MTRLLNFDRSSVLLASGLAFLGGVLALALVVAGVQRANDVAAVQSLDVQSQLMSVLSDLQDAESGQRGFIITGDPAFLDRYNDASEKTSGTLAELQRATQDHPAQHQAAAKLAAVADDRLKLLRRGVSLRQGAGFHAASAFVSQGDSERLMGAARREIATMTAGEAQILNRRLERSKQSFAILRWMLISGFGLVVLLTAAKLRVASRRLNLAEFRRDELNSAKGKLVVEAHDREEADAKIRQMQKLEAVGQLTGGIAHDFNNMLTIVIGSLELATRRLTSDPVKAAGYIASAQDGAKRAAALTARLLAFSRQQNLEPVACDPNTFVASMSEMLRRTIGEHLKIETVLAGGIWSVYVDASQLENAVLNLCVNARDAMPDGGKLTIETANSYLDDAYALRHPEVGPGQYVVISVSDTGTGMTADVIRRAFEPFFTTKEVGKGTGLGLSQVFGFVKQSGGSVEIYSELLTGTSIKIYLPRWTAGLDAAPAQTALAPLQGRGETILVVEDDAMVRQISVDTLTELGYTVIPASSGEAALAIMGIPGGVDLLFTDFVMPGMTGQMLANEASAKFPGVRILMTTGYARNAAAHSGFIEPQLAFLPKPFTMKELADKIAEVLSSPSSSQPRQTIGADAV